VEFRKRWQLALVGVVAVFMVTREFRGDQFVRKWFREVPGELPIHLSHAGQFTILDTSPRVSVTKTSESSFSESVVVVNYAPHKYVNVALVDRINFRKRPVVNGLTQFVSHLDGALNFSGVVLYRKGLSYIVRHHLHCHVGNYVLCSHGADILDNDVPNGLVLRVLLEEFVDTGGVDRDVSAVSPLGRFSALLIGRDSSVSGTPSMMSGSPSKKSGDRGCDEGSYGHSKLQIDQRSLFVRISGLIDSRLGCDTVTGSFWLAIGVTWLLCAIGVWGIWRLLNGRWISGALLLAILIVGGPALFMLPG